MHQSLRGAKIAVEVADMKVEPLRDGLKSALKDIFVVAKLLPKAPKMLKAPTFSFLNYFNWCMTAHPELTQALF